MSELDSEPPRGEQTLEGRGSAALLEAPAGAEQRVTPLELFFDLVFVFAITQVTGYVYSDPTWTRFVEGLAILAVLWFGWSCYAWLGNNANTDDGLVRVILLSAIAAMVITSLAVPRAFGADGLLFGIAYFVVRLLHIACYTALARDLHDATLGRAVARLASTMLPAAAVLVAAGALAGTPRAICWAVALAIDYGGIVLRGVEGWRVEPGHFAERHSAVIIIALGESVVALGVGAHSGLSLSGSVIAGALLGITAISALWWVYFDMVSIVGERRFRSAAPRAQVLIARDSYTLLHLFMVGGIVVFAIGVEGGPRPPRRAPRGCPRGRAVRRARALSARAERLQETQPRDVQPTPSVLRRTVVGAYPSRCDRGARARRPCPRDDDPVRADRL